MHELFGTVPLGAADLGVALAASSTILLADELYKWIAGRKARR
jgi:hypothetical protein